MDEHAVETAMLSLSSPGVWFGNAEEARAPARRINEYGAELVRNHSGRFGLFSRHRTKATVCSHRPELVGIV